MEPVVYILKSESTGMCYVGSTVNLTRRLIRHFSNLNTKTHHNVKFQELWDTRGDFDLHLTIECPTVEQAQQLELRLIQRFLAEGVCLNIGLGTNGGDNLTLNPNRQEILLRKASAQRRMYAKLSKEEKSILWGRPGSDNPMFGKRHSEETREKISQHLKSLGMTPWNKGLPILEHVRAAVSESAKKRVGELNHFYGKSHSEETKEKIREAKLGKTTGQGFKVLIDGVVYDSYYSASATLDIPIVTIRWRCLSENPKFKNYQLLSKSPTTTESTLGLNG